MPTYVPSKFSESTNGRPTKVTATSSGGAQLLHTAHASSLDHIILSAWNTDSSERTLHVLFGATTDDLVVVIPANSGIVLVVPREARISLTGSATLSVFASDADYIWVIGSIVRIT